MDAAVNPQQGRHRGTHRDPLGTVLTVLWGLGHIATLALLGTAAQHQLGAEHQFAAPPTRTLPDRESTA
ncbi:hypothetical protein ACIRST_29105 [Kitasatospora sp. NPDC101447]|uniref:hypothetical protein n=1 Tax=Kitasatospora sp. NPDC101447 TaxID=3364102 RepID=UPI0037F9544E